MFKFKCEYLNNTTSMSCTLKDVYWQERIDRKSRIKGYEMKELDQTEVSSGYYRFQRRLRRFEMCNNNL